MYPLEAVTQVTNIAAQIQNSFAVRKGIALAQAINLVEPVYGNTLEPLRKILPAAEHDVGYLNATQIGEKLGGLNAQKVNQMLAQANLQYKDGKDWRITEDGKNYGEEMPYTKNGHSGYQRKWNDGVITVLGEYIN